MEKPTTRSSRRLPARSGKSAERSSSKGRASKDTDSPKAVNSPRLSRRIIKETEQKENATVKASPPRRRSRSRSNARKKQETVTEVKNVYEKDFFNEKYNLRNSKPMTPPATKIVSRLKQGVDQVLTSVSPDVEEVVRRSVSRFEEVTNEVVSTVLTRRSSSRLSSRSSPIPVIGNNVPADFVIEEEEEKTVVITNHVGTTKKEKSPSRSVKKLNYLSVLAQVFVGVLMCASVVIAHFVCSKEDCRLLVANMDKALDPTQYFDSYAWPVYSLSLLLLIAGFILSCHKSRRPQLFSIIGGLAVVALIVGIWAYDHYLRGLQQLKILQLVGATIVHILALISYAGSSVTLAKNAHLESFVQMSSSIITVLLNASILAVERSRAVPNLGVLMLCGFAMWIGLDHLLLPPLSHGLGPLGILWLSLRPFVLILPQIYVSANNVAIGTYTLIAVAATHAVGFLLYRYSSWLKIAFLRDPYSPAFSKSSCCGDFAGGPYSRVRHPHLLGLLLCELSSALVAAPSLLGLTLVLVSSLSYVAIAHSANRLLSRIYRDRVSSSLIPLVPY